jgi:hypothetical protein
MADFDSADLLSKLKTQLQRPETDDASTDPQLYSLLSAAQSQIMQVIAAHVPWTQYGAPELLTTTDSGLTYTFASWPMGHAVIREAPDGLPLNPVPEWAPRGSGYVMEGQSIRWPGGESRTFSDGPYARYVARPPQITASVQPVLIPADMRWAIVYDAAVKWANLGGLRDPSPYAFEYQRLMYNDPNTPGALGFIPTHKTQMHGSGGAAHYDGRWWAGIR